MSKYYAKVKLTEDGRLILSGRGMGWIKDEDGFWRTVSYE